MALISLPRAAHILVTAALTCASLPAQTPVTDVVERTVSAVVSVDVLFEKTGVSGKNLGRDYDAVRVQRPGSGVLVSETGLVLTNAHLVAEVQEADGEYWIAVVLASGAEYRASVVRWDEATDLALLQLEVPPDERFVALPVARSRDQTVGARVIALSAPGVRQSEYVFAGALAFASGPVQLREVTLEPWQALISDCRFHDLLDGGPLLNARGEIIGIHNSSHLSPRPEGFDAEPEDGEEVVDLDYAVIVSGEAIEAVMGELLRDAAPLAPTPSRAASDDVAPAAIARIAPAVVSVWRTTEGEHPSTGDPADPQSQRIPDNLGSGVVIDPTGLVLACSSLFGELDVDASIMTAEGALYPATVVARRKQNQIVLLRASLPPETNLPAATLADSTEVVPGEFVAVVARPFAAEVNASVGVLSAVERDGLVQLASWVHPGHRGGAVVDRDGHLIGITVQEPAMAHRVDKDTYLGFASPISTILEALEEEWADQGAGNRPEPATQKKPLAPQSAVSKVAELTRSSLINIMVSKAVERNNSGFDPFGSDDADSYEPLGQGSGVIIEATGLALSNWHVVDAALANDGSQKPDHKVEVTLPDGRSFEARVLSTSRDDDLSLLALEIGPTDELVPVRLGDSDALVPGQPVIAIGNPLGLANSLSTGIITSLDRDTRIQGRLREYKGMVMTDTAINPGNSGGALLDLEGRLVGINSAARVGLGMAIPVNKAREVFSAKLLSARSLRTAYLGVKVVERRGGLVVDEIDPEGPAYRAGARIEDKVHNLAGEQTPTQAAWARVILDLSDDTACTMTVGREDQLHELEVHPISFATWEIAQSSGIEVAELDYSAQTQLVHDASIALHRGYTQSPTGEPTRLMSGALRVARVGSLFGKERPPVQAGDLLLGITSYERGTTAVHERLRRFESIADLSAAITPLATKEGGSHQFWLLRDGEIKTLEVFIRRPPR
jgi:S1-C subfamily serine protease